MLHLSSTRRLRRDALLALRKQCSPGHVHLLQQVRLHAALRTNTLSVNSAKYLSASMRPALVSVHLRSRQQLHVVRDVVIFTQQALTRMYSLSTQCAQQLGVTLNRFGAANGLAMRHPALAKNLMQTVRAQHSACTSCICVCVAAVVQTSLLRLASHSKRLTLVLFPHSCVCGSCVIAHALQRALRSNRTRRRAS